VTPDGRGQPLWIAQTQAWICRELDKREDAAFRKLVNEAKTYTHVLNERLSHLDNDEKARRKKRGLAKTQQWLEEVALRQAEQGNFESLRKLYPKLARFINKPKLGRGERLEKPSHPAHDRLEQAIAELPRARELLKTFYKWKRAHHLKGQLTAEQVLATRWDLDAQEIRKRRISRARLKRERA
jgi:hypothetical protein